MCEYIVYTYSSARVSTAPATDHRTYDTIYTRGPSSYIPVTRRSGPIDRVDRLFLCPGAFIPTPITTTIYKYTYGMRMCVHLQTPPPPLLYLPSGAAIARLFALRCARGKRIARKADRSPWDSMMESCVRSPALLSRLQPAGRMPEGRAPAPHMHKLPVFRVRVSLRAKTREAHVRECWGGVWCEACRAVRPLTGVRIIMCRAVRPCGADLGDPRLRPPNLISMHHPTLISCLTRRLHLLQQGSALGVC